MFWVSALPKMNKHAGWGGANAFPDLHLNDHICENVFLLCVFFFDIHTNILEVVLHEYKSNS